MPDVTICIPAINASAFIDRTLRCAREQTLGDIRILVSVDRSDDATADICRVHAGEDPRIMVTEHRERIGWARNANSLIDSVTTEFFCFYFHDDIIEPAFGERLVTALQGRPDAVSAHCDMGLFGAREETKPGAAYEGSAVERICRFMLRQQRGSPLRSMTRIAGIGSLRLPTDAPNGFWANEPYLAGLIAAGPALHVPEVLYRRWDKRKGGLTDGWLNLGAEDVAAGLAVNARASFSVIDGLTEPEELRAVARYAVALFLGRQAAGWAKKRRAEEATVRAIVDPLLAVGPPPALRTMPEDIQSMVREREAQLGLLWA